MEKPDPKKEARVEAVMRRSQSYSGPLPMPEDLEKYDQVVPGAAERIIRMAEKEMQHRHESDNRMMKSVIRTTAVSILFAFLSVVILSFLVYYALYRGYDKVAGAIAVGSIAAVAGVFIYFKKEQGKAK